MRSWRFLLSRRWLLFGAVVVLLCYVAWLLGQWQFQRLDARQDRNAVVRVNEDRDPADVADVLAPGRTVAAEDEWRRVTATGQYDEANTIVVRYRTREGKSGIDVVVPLVTTEGPTLLVNRGWLATDNQGTSPDDVPAPPTGEVTVDGWVRGDATGNGTAVDNRSTRAISSTRIGAAIDQETFGGFVMLEAEDGDPAADLEPVELPELNNGPHFFYGLQWWFFGGLAIFGFGYLAWDERRGRQHGDVRTAPTGDTPKRKGKRAEKNARKQAVRAAYQKAYEAERRERKERQSARSIPPSTGTIAPDTKDDAGESRNAATRPNSSGSP